MFGGGGGGGLSHARFGWELEDGKKKLVMDGLFGGNWLGEGGMVDRGVGGVKKDLVLSLPCKPDSACTHFCFPYMIFFCMRGGECKWLSTANSHG